MILLLLCNGRLYIYMVQSQTFPHFGLPITQLGTNNDQILLVEILSWECSFIMLDSYKNAHISAPPQAH